MLTGAVLARMIRTIVINDTNFKTLVHYIRKLGDTRYELLK